MHCNACNIENRRNARFCRLCGGELTFLVDAIVCDDPEIVVEDLHVDAVLTERVAPAVTARDSGVVAETESDRVDKALRTLGFGEPRSPQTNHGPVESKKNSAISPKRPADQVQSALRAQDKSSTQIQTPSSSITPTATSTQSSGKTLTLVPPTDKSDDDEPSDGKGLFGKDLGSNGVELFGGKRGQDGFSELFAAARRQGDSGVHQLFTADNRGQRPSYVDGATVSRNFRAGDKPHCDKCAISFRRSDRFCTECGGMLMRPEAGVPVDSRSCIRCNSSLSFSHKYCPCCGNALSSDFEPIASDLFGDQSTDFLDMMPSS